MFGEVTQVENSVCTANIMLTFYVSNSESFQDSAERESRKMATKTVRRECNGKSRAT
jgi:hypothetical protein